MRKSVKYFALGCCLLVLLSGCSKAPEPVLVETTAVTETTPKVTVPPAVNVEDQRKLRIDVDVVDEEVPKWTNIPVEELGGNFDDKLTYLDVTNVSIEVDGETYHLEDAIRDGVISVEEILAYARMDARMGYCREQWKTFHSLTHFIYRYPKFDLRMSYDVLKTPDGKEHLIQELYVCDNAYTLSTTYLDIDREDWGLNFEVVETTSTSLTMDCTQSGGQQLGELTTDNYWIYSLDDEGNTEIVRHFDLNKISDPWLPKSTIHRDSTTRITLDWTDIYGELPKGRYAMHLSINDEFDPTTIHPLMEDFQNRLAYWIEFTIS